MQFKWKLVQLDIKTVFLYGELDEVIYMKQPLGFIKGNLEKTVFVEKTIVWPKTTPKTVVQKIQFICLEAWV